jgi:nitrite reductase/ring-hydroxylating ferredoxin subunit
MISMLVMAYWPAVSNSPSLDGEAGQATGELFYEMRRLIAIVTREPTQPPTGHKLYTSYHVEQSLCLIYKRESTDVVQRHGRRRWGGGGGKVNLSMAGATDKRRAKVFFPVLLLLHVNNISLSHAAFVRRCSILNASPRVMAVAPRHAASVPSYRVIRRAPMHRNESLARDVTITVSLADGRNFTFQDACPPTNHSLLHAEIDPEILSIRDPVFGTRFDMRTGNLRGMWCPQRWWARNLFEPAGLVLLSSSTTLKAEDEKSNKPKGNESA